MPLDLKKEERINGDRRKNRRYPIVLQLRWKLIRRRKILFTGDGHTIDLSTGGLLFDAGRLLPAGMKVELSVAWPVLLEEQTPMRLALQGRIVRSQGNLTAARIVQHEFRTSGGGSSDPRRGVLQGPFLLMGGATLGASRLH